MNELSQIASDLWQVLKDRKTLFVTWTPDLSDFRSNQPFILKICVKGRELEIPMPSQKNFLSFVGMLGKSIFAKDKVVIGWNLKQFFSYLKFHLPQHWHIPVYCQFFDLKLGESFTGINGVCPSTYVEAAKRTGILLNNPNYVEYNNKVLTPLSVEVIPAIETVGITNKITGNIQHSCYYIEGQVNGRLSSNVPFEGFFNPHTLTSEQKNEFSCGHEKKFVVFDYKHMEVSVLAWLSKDDRLKEIIESGQDIYSVIYCDISGSNKCSDNNRKLIKDIFLPIVYGVQEKTLAKNTGISINGAIKLMDFVHEKFNKALSWVKAQQDQLKQSSTIKNHFGRVMDFSDGSGREPWSIRNAVIQGPAALICLDKLIKLYQNKISSINIIASVHDAYVCTVDSSSMWAAIEYAKQILESPSQFAPDCVLKVGVQYGERWGNLIEMKNN